MELLLLWTCNAMSVIVEKTGHVVSWTQKHFSFTTNSSYRQKELWT